MNQLEFTLAVLTILATVGSILVYLHDRKNKRIRPMVQIPDIVRVLGGKDKLLSDIKKKQEMDKLIRKGIPYAACRYLQDKMKITDLELCTFIGQKDIPLQDGDGNSSCSIIASDRLYRLARIFAAATVVLEDENKAAEWLKRPQRSLGEVAPIEMAITEIGVKTVETLLGRIEYSVL